MKKWQRKVYNDPSHDSYLRLRLKGLRSSRRDKAIKAGVDFNISIQDLVDLWVDRCPIFGFPLVFGDDGPNGRSDSPSIDRIDPTRGYERGNIQIISKLANSMKQNATEKQMIQFAEWIIDEYV